MVAKCQAKTRNGKPCSAKPRPDSSWCPWHDPALAAKRSEWSARGGANRANEARAAKALPAEPLTTAEAHAYLSLAFRRAMVGKMDAPMLNALSSAAKALADLSRTVEQDAVIAELEAKLVRLERRAPA